jgi:hypothetical protein
MLHDDSLPLLLFSYPCIISVFELWLSSSLNGLSGLLLLAIAAVADISNLPLLLSSVATAL